MASAYRVAAPSIRIVPWAALASCWPLPQQLLPVSATGGGRRRCTLAIFSGRIIYNFAFVALCGARQTHFHGRGRRGKRQMQRRFLRKRGAAGYPFRHGYRRATFPKGTAFGGSGKVSGIAQRRPLGGAGERSEPEGVLSASTNKKLPRRVAGGAFIFLF